MDQKNMDRLDKAAESSLTVLVVDDSSAMRKIVARMLRSAFIHSVLEAESGENALEVIQNANHPTPDIIISDLHMEPMDGMELMNHLRLHKIMIPMLILTADRDHLVHEVARQVGAVKVLMKPILALDLIHEIGAITGYEVSSHAVGGSMEWA